MCLIQWVKNEIPFEELSVEPPGRACRTTAFLPSLLSSLLPFFPSSFLLFFLSSDTARILENTDSGTRVPEHGFQSTDSGNTDSGTLLPYHTDSGTLILERTDSSTDFGTLFPENSTDSRVPATAQIIALQGMSAARVFT